MGINTDVSILVEGISSKKSAYYLVKINEKGNAISIYDDDYVERLFGDDDNVEIMEDDDDEFNSFSKQLDDGSYEHYIYLDDVTTEDGNFKEIFDDFYPGEDLRISMEKGSVSWSKLKTDADNAESGTDSTVMTGRTNSLFADGSNNNNYEKNTSKYNDVNPEYAIVEPADDKAAYAGTALVMNFRHLQNLDYDLAVVQDDDDNDNKNKDSVYKTITKAKLCKDLYWKAFAQDRTNEMPTKKDEYYIDFITAINDERTYSADSVDIYSGETIKSQDNSFYGIVNNYITEFDGQNHTINNVVIANETDECAGLFRTIAPVNDKTITLKNFSMIEPVVISTVKDAGSIIGNATGNGTGTLNMEYVFAYGKYALARTLSSDTNSKTGANAGGLIGSASMLESKIENCGASVYVYADSSRCAGGFIGNFQPRGTSYIRYSFVGGHVSKDKQYNDRYAVNGGVNNITNQGGINICGYIATGGFFGYIGTSSIKSIKVEHCFTTASVYTTKANNSTYTASGGAVGGFIGRLQHEYQQYFDCYAAGKIFIGTDMVGGFVGHEFKNNDYQGEKLPHYVDSFVLHGVDFNNNIDEEHLVNFGSPANSTKRKISGLKFVDSDNVEIQNRESSNVDVITFNLGDAEYPYRDMVENINSNGLSHKVFYGDWMVPEPIQTVKLINGNRLTAHIFLNDKTSTTTQDINGYYETYIKIEGEKHGDQEPAVAYYQIRYNKNSVKIYRKDENNYQEYINAGMPKAIYNSLSNTLDFYIDNISNYDSNYSATMSWSRTPQGLPKAWPGENITISAGKTFDTAKNQSDTKLKATDNSIFDSLEDNKDGTYTAHISNSRHLENLYTWISGNWNNNSSLYNITKVIQDDNIYWQDDGSYAGTLSGKSYSAKTLPYLTELPGAVIYGDNSNPYSQPLTDSGKFHPIRNMADRGLQIAEYDGNGKTLINFSINYATQGSHNAGLFEMTDTDFTIKNLTIVNPTVNLTDKSDSVGVLLGSTDAEKKPKLTISDVNITGVSTVDGKINLGGLAGSVAEATITNTSIDSTMMVGTGGTVSTAGGMIGNAEKINITNSKIMGTTTIDGKNDIGGLVGKVKEATITGTSIESNMSIGSAGTASTAGGMVGRVDTKLNIETSSYNGPSLYVKGTGDSANASGIAGNVSGDFTLKDSFINAITLNVTTDSLIGGTQYTGGFAGYVGGVTNINSSKLICIAGMLNSSTGSSYTGGFIGYPDNNVTVKDSEINATSLSITTSGSSAAYSGGIISVAKKNFDILNTKIKGSSAKSIRIHSSAPRESMSGGLVGQTDQSFSLKDSSCEIDGLDIQSLTATNCYSGGIVGRTKSDINLEKFNTTMGIVYVTCNNLINSYSGGIVGKAEYSFNITDCNIDDINLNVSTQSVKDSNQNTGGLAGYVDGESYIANLNLKCTNINITSSDGGKKYAGGFIGYANSTITCNTSYIDMVDSFNIECKESGRAYAGGIVGWSATKLNIQNVHFRNYKYGPGVNDYTEGTLSIKSKASRTGYAGGFAGNIVGGVNCEDSDIRLTKVTVISDSNSGGLFATVLKDAVIKDTVLKAVTVDIEGQLHIGGIIGAFSGYSDFYPGKLDIDGVGITAPLGSIKINGNGGYAYVGGFIGRTGSTKDMTITNSYSAVFVDAEVDDPEVTIGDFKSVGGFAGSLEVMDSGSGVISACYVSAHTLNSYDVISNAKYIGGFAGSIIGPITVSKSFVTNRICAVDPKDENGNLKFTPYIGGFAGLVGKGVTIEAGCYSVGKVIGSDNSIDGAFIGFITTLLPNGSTLSNAKIGIYYVDSSNAKIGNIYYVDRYIMYYNGQYHRYMTGIGLNDTGSDYDNIIPVGSTDTRIYKKNPMSTNSEVYNNALYDPYFKNGYPYTNWDKTTWFHGDWIKP